MRDSTNLIPSACPAILLASIVWTLVILALIVLTVTIDKLIMIINAFAKMDSLRRMSLPVLVVATNVKLAKVKLLPAYHASLQA